MRKTQILINKPVYLGLPILESCSCHINSDTANIQAIIECRFTLKCVHDMIITYSQMHHLDKYSQHSSVIWLVWLNG